MFKKASIYFLASVILFAVITAILSISFGDKFALGRKVASKTYPHCFDIERPRYPLRHWQWSGILPFEGGFIPDPHILCSDAQKAVSSVTNLIAATDVEFELVDINPFFDDDSTEVLLVVKADSNLFEFALDVPKGTKGVLAHGLQPKAQLFKYEEKIAVFIDLFSEEHGDVTGFYLIDLPLRTGSLSPLHEVDTAVSKDIIEQLREHTDRDELRGQLCKTKFKPFREFFEEQIVDQCPPLQPWKPKKLSKNGSRGRLQQSK